MSQSDGPRTPKSPSTCGVETPASSPRPAAKAPPESAAASAEAAGNSTAQPDVVVIHGPTDDQKGLRVLRAREQGLELGELRPIQEGKPLAGDIVKLKPRAGMPRVCDVETQLSREELDQLSGGAGRRLGHAGPARVSSDAYRTNWDAIYGPPGPDRPGPAGRGQLN